MDFEQFRFVIVIAVLACVGASVAGGFVYAHGSGTWTSNAIESDAPRIQGDGSGPTVQLQFERRNITPANATSFVLYVGNPTTNDQPIHLLVLLTADASREKLDMLVDERRGIGFGDRIIWRFNYDLSPGEYRLTYGSIHRNAEPGTYGIEANATYRTKSGLTSKITEATLFIEDDRTGGDNGRNGSGGPLTYLGRAVGLIIAVFWKYPQIIAAIVAVLALLVSIVEGDRTSAAILRGWQRTKDILQRITRWAFRN